MPEERDSQYSSEWRNLVSELHHRLKNNLQTITGVISLQASRITDPKIATVLRATQNRVRAIAGVFGARGTADMATIHFGDYLGELVRELAAEYAISDRVEMEVVNVDLAVDTDQAIGLALIANEVIANAFEHAFPNGARGKIYVKLNYAGAYGELEIRDNGRGLPAGWNYETADSTGFYLIRALTSQLKGQIRLEEHSPGTAFRLTFPLDSEESDE